MLYNLDMKGKYFSLFLLITLFNTYVVSAQPVSKEKELWQPYFVTPRAGAQHIDLSGAWMLSHRDTSAVTPAELRDRKDPFETTIPNSVHWSYYKAGKLPHPYAHLNSTQYRWIEEKAWYYEKEVVIPASAKGSNILLCFDGIDYFSRIWVNDSLIGVHEGMFGGPVADISGIARYGDKNTILVEVRAANWGNRATDFENLPRTASGEFDYSKRKGFNPRASGRITKPWVLTGGSGTEAFFVLGMWQGARIEIVPQVHLERPYLTTTRITGSAAVLHLSAEVLAKTTSLSNQLHPWRNAQIHHPDAKGKPFTPASGTFSAAVKFTYNGKVAFGKEFPLSIYEGKNWLEQDLTIPNPRLWYPNGLGNPDQYEVTVALKENGKIIDELVFDYGIRTIERLPSAGPRTAERWENWQFVVNGKKLFVKGMNWTPADVLLDLPEERYRWALEAAKNMGIQLIRIWGGGILETDHFYNICNELGIMVWQDFPIGNQDTPDYPQDIWEAQVVQNIFRLRNHPSLAVWCGGNEFNPYSYGNAASVGIVERNLDIFDKSRLFVRTTPDDGSMHAYPDMDPTWYNRSYKFEPWVSETGMHSMPEAGLFYELVDNSEFKNLGKMWDREFFKDHPEFIHHFTEYGPARVPRMLSRASHIDDMSDPSIESVTEASQVGAGEWYQIVSEKMQGNYPVTTGLMPWVFKRHWPVIAIQMMDWFGQAAAPYYFMKRTYEPTHVALDLDRLLWAPGEDIRLETRVTHAPGNQVSGKVSVTVYDDQFTRLWRKELGASLRKGPSVNGTDFGSYRIPAGYKDRYLFVVAELRGAGGNLVSRSVYHPRVLSKMEDKAFFEQYTKEPIPWITLDKGPWLKPTVARAPTRLQASVVSRKAVAGDRSQLTIRVTNQGDVPSFMTKLDITGTKRAFFASDNYFWLAPGESREIMMEVLWRDPATANLARPTVQAWNVGVTHMK